MLRVALFPLLLLFVWPSTDAKGVYRLIPLGYAHHDANVLTQDGSGPSPYSFSYTAEGIDGSSSHRETGSASGAVSGSYSLKVKDGRSRQVDYTADAGGFKASVDTNEPGTKSDNPAEVSFKSSAPQPVPAGIALITAGGHAISYQSGGAAPSPYSFGYTAEGADGGSSHQESGDGAGNVRGRYSLKVKDGRSRQVDYSADAGGFKAKINTNELGTKTGSSADAEFISSASLGPAAAPSLYAGVAPVIGGGVSMQMSHGVGPAGEGAPSPYSFSYTAEGADGGSSHEEASDGAGNVRGSYSLKVKDGRRRKVDYTASSAGFKATVNTNEPGTKSDSPADAPFYSSAPDLTPAIAAPAPAIPAFGLPSPVIPSAGAGAVAVTYQGTGEGAPSPYSFSYNVEAPDGGSSRQESSDGAGNVRGSYSLKVKDGRSRHVDYSADAGGFKAKVNTNEPGTKSDSPAEVSFYSSAPQLPAIDIPLAQVPAAQPLPAGGALISFYAGAAGAAEGAPKPYSFGYNAEGIDGSSSHQESADGSGRVRGSYALKIKDGRRRKVDYTADAGGFKASVDTNEPGTKSDSPAEVSFQSSAPQDVPAIGLPAASPLIPSPGPVSYHGAIGAPDGATGGPYSFQYTATAPDGSSSRQESSDGAGNVRGSYSLSINDGRNRQVDYSADAGGFKADVKTNEPGTKSGIFPGAAPVPVHYAAVAPAPATVGGPPSAIQFQITPSGAEGAPSPYSFSYTADGIDGSSSHQETGDGSGSVRGSYSLKIKDGRSRKVDYTADTAGFKAQVDTNEPGTKSENPAQVSFHSSAPQALPAVAAGAPVVPAGGAAISYQGGFLTGEGKASYNFGYSAQGAEGGSSHQESGDGSGRVTGSYSLNVKDGRKRKVDYSADAAGFKASVDTNEPGTKSENPAEVSFHSSADLTAGHGLVAQPYLQTFFNGPRPLTEREKKWMKSI